MSHSNRGGFFEAITGLFFLILATLVIVTTWKVATLTAIDRQQAEQSAKDYADRTHERIASTCINLAGPTLAKCADEIIKSSHEAQTAQHDLAAQRGMERWAMAMFWASLASVAMTGVGIYYVHKTLEANSAAVDQAKDANNISRNIGAVQTRAWISFHNFQFGGVGVIGKVQQYNFSIALNNKGSTPAFYVVVVFDYEPSDTWGNKSKYDDGMEFASTVGPNSMPFYTNNLIFSPEEILIMKEKPIFVRCGVRYKTVFDGDATWRHTEFTVRIKFIGAHSLSDIVAGEIKSDNFEVRFTGNQNIMT